MTLSKLLLSPMIPHVLGVEAQATSMEAMVFVLATRHWCFSRQQRAADREAVHDRPQHHPPVVHTLLAK